MSPWGLIDVIRELLKNDPATLDAVLQWAWASRFTDGVRARLLWASNVARAGMVLPREYADLEQIFLFDVARVDAATFVAAMAQGAAA